MRKRLPQRGILSRILSCPSAIIGISNDRFVFLQRIDAENSVLEDGTFAACVQANSQPQARYFELHFVF